MTTDLLQELLGYRFSDETILFHALTHSSYANEEGLGTLASNERLEFLGDAVLELCVSRRLYQDFPEKPEGELTVLRAALVCERSLAACARQLGLGDLLRFSKGEQSAGRDRDSILCDAFESVLGAVYLDGGLDPCAAITDRFVMTDLRKKLLSHDSKTRLQELIQARPGHCLEYRLAKTFGPDHRRVFTMEAVLDGRVVGQGSGSSKKAASQEAAYQALLYLDPNPPTESESGSV